MSELYQPSTLYLQWLELEYLDTYGIKSKFLVNPDSESTLFLSCKLLMTLHCFSQLPPPPLLKCTLVSNAVPYKHTLNDCLNLKYEFNLKGVFEINPDPKSNVLHCSKQNNRFLS